MATVTPGGGNSSSNTLPEEPGGSGAGTVVFENLRGNLLVVVEGTTNATVASIAPIITTRPADVDRVFPRMTVPSVSVSVGTSATKAVGPIPCAYNDANGNVTIELDETSGVMVFGFRVAS